jgi:hypothetical protein
MECDGAEIILYEEDMQRPVMMKIDTILSLVFASPIPFMSDPIC